MALMDRISHGRRIAAVVVVAVLALAGATSATSDGPAPAADASSNTRTPPVLGLGGEALDRRPAPPDTSQGGLLLDKRGYRRFPDVPGALQTVHFRNNNRGQIAGTYVDDSDGTPRVRGFLMQPNGRVTRIDVPGAVGTLPIGINDRGQVVGGYFGPDATIDPDTGEYSPTHGFVWTRRHITTLDIPGATTTAAYEITPKLRSFLLERGRYTAIDAPNRCDTAAFGLNDRGQIIIAAPGTTDGTTCPPQPQPHPPAPQTAL